MLILVSKFKSIPLHLKVRLKLLGTNIIVSMKKENSTNSINEKGLKEKCGITYAISLIGGRWKPTILWNLTLKDKLRYNELRKIIPCATERMLVLQLRELEADGLVERIIYPVVPPKVEYQLSDKGKSLKAVLETITSWGERELQQ